MPFDFTCLTCGEKLEVNLDNGQLQCVGCGRLLDGSLPPKANPAQASAIKSLRENESWKLGAVYFAGERTRWIDTLLNRLRFELDKGDRAAAIKTCNALIDMDRNMVDAYYWRAKLGNDPQARRKDLSKALSIQPKHGEARQLLMVLNGEITEAELKAASDLYRDNRQQADGPAPAAVEVLLCPVCRGTLTVNDGGGVECNFCGFADEDTDHAVTPTPASSLVVALIKQRAKPVRWEVGERVLACEGCGAVRTIPARKMSHQCPFCGSTNVVTQDALDTFRQPDGLLKFRVRREQAGEHVHEVLKNPRERIKGLFSNNRVTRTDIEGIFLPHWVFDVFGTAIVREEQHDSDGHVIAINRLEMPVHKYDLAVPATKSPPPHLLRRLAPYDFREVAPYTPKLLARFPAELYSIDFDAASMDARTLFRQYTKSVYNSTPDTTRTVTNQIDHMEMKLVMVPLWVLTLHEADGDLRLALVNGQTGAVALGKAAKPTG
jgi:uncharacterized protein YbaR (Trm112 family)